MKKTTSILVFLLLLLSLFVEASTPYPEGAHICTRILDKAKGFDLNSSTAWIVNEGQYNESYFFKLTSSPYELPWIQGFVEEVGLIKAKVHIEKQGYHKSDPLYFDNNFTEEQKNAMFEPGCFLNHTFYLTPICGDGECRIEDNETTATCPVDCPPKPISTSLLATAIIILFLGSVGYLMYFILTKKKR